MAENNAGGSAPVITQGQTTAPGADTHAVEEAGTLEGEVTQQRQPGFFDNWLLWAVAALWIWYLFGNKKRKQARAQEKKDRERRNALQKGDEIVTIGRVHGKVVSFTDKTVTIKVDPKSDYTMMFDREAIYRVLPRPGEEQPDDAAQQAAADAASGGAQNG